MELRQSIKMIMKFLRFLLFLNLFLLWNCTNSFEIYVSPDGDKSNNGMKEKPFNEIGNAVELAKKLKAEDSSSIVNINLLSGDYILTKPIVITPQLSGLKILGVDNSDVRIKGSIPVNLNWDELNENIFVAIVPDIPKFDQLIVNNEPQILARYPNYNEDGGCWQGYAADALSKERLASWGNSKGAIFHALRKGRWGGFHYLVTGLDKNGEAILEGGHQNNRPNKPHPKYRMVENVLEELDSPGEWYFDEISRKLYYWPKKRLDLNKAEIEVVVAKSFIELKGTVENPVKDISIKGIKFEYTQRTIFEEYEPLLRSDWTMYRGGAVYLEGTENSKISDCEFSNLGGNVIFVSGYNDNVNISCNHINNCGASGISFVGHPSAVRSPSFQYQEYVPIAEMDTLPGPKNELYPRNSIVENNLIHRIGRIEKQTAGIQISMAMNITVSHNSIYDVPRAGINIGDGTWGGHIIEYNDVFNTVLETGDHGSFNSWGRDRFWHPKRKVMDSLTMANPDMPYWDAIYTTIIRNNRFRCDHGWDIDLDDGSSNYHIYNNLCLNGGIKLREGFYRLVENNIIVNNGFHPHVWFVNSKDIFRKNIVEAGHKDVRLEGWGQELDYNLFPNEESLMKAQIYNIESHSSFGDPKFMDPSELDYRVADNSPAIQLGFKNFPMDKFGVQKPALKEITKTPEVPFNKIEESFKSKKSATFSWLRNKIKSVDSKEEQSAYGFGTPGGVIVLKVWDKSRAVKNGGIKKDDVIVQLENEKVNNVKDFFSLLKKNNNKENIKVTVVRNQSEINLSLKLK